jgi:hypothetical protein
MVAFLGLWFVITLGGFLDIPTHRRKTYGDERGTALQGSGLLLRINVRAECRQGSVGM